MKRIIFAALAAFAMTGSAHAAITLTVNGTDQPWFSSATKNSSFQFGVNDGTGPAVATFASAGIAAGGSYSVLFKSGLTSAFGGAAPSVDNGGYAGSPFKDDNPGSSGNYFPSHYLSGSWSANPNEGVFLNALVYVFTDALGNIIGNPISLGTIGSNGNSRLIGISATAPAGATQIQFGVNDDIFSDNSGALKVCVGAGGTCSFAAPTPEPEAWASMIVGVGLAGAAVRRRRRKAAEARAISRWYVQVA